MLEWLTHFRTVVAFSLGTCQLSHAAERHLGGETMDATKGYVQGKRL